LSSALCTTRVIILLPSPCLFFLTPPPHPDIYILSLHDALPILKLLALAPAHRMHRTEVMEALWPESDPEASGTNLRKALHFARLDRKSTRLNSSHQIISYAVFCLKKKKDRPDRTVSQRRPRGQV